VLKEPSNASESIDGVKSKACPNHLPAVLCEISLQFWINSSDHKFLAEKARKAKVVES